MSEALPTFPNHKGEKVKLIRKQKIDAPIYSIIVQVGNIHGSRVRNCVKSIKLQTAAKIETIVVDYGSNAANHKNLMQTLKPFNCTVYYCPTKQIWSTAIARNIGIRRTKSKYVAAMDVDCILEPRVVEGIIKKHEEKPRIIAIGPSLLPKSINIDKLVLPRDYTKLEKVKKKYLGPSVGAFVSAPRNWWRKVRGFDERMSGWGPIDRDLWTRAQRDKEIKCLRARQLGLPKTRIYHQYHGVRTRANLKLNRLIWTRDKTIVKNRENWGIFP